MEDGIVRGAILLMGELRGMSWPNQTSSIAGFIQRAGASRVIGIFGSLATPAHTTQQAILDCNATLQRIIANHPMAKVIISIESNAQMQSNFDGTTASPQEQHRGTMPHLWRMHQAFTLMLQHEHQHSRVFQRILCMRTDSVFPELPRNWLVSPAMVMAADAVYMHHDQVFLGTRTAIQALSGVWSEGVQRGFGTMTRNPVPRPGLLPIDWSRITGSEWTTSCSNFAWCLDLPMELGFERNQSQRVALRLLRRRVNDGSLKRLSASTTPSLTLNQTVVNCPWLREAPFRWEQDVFLGASALLSTSLRLLCITPLFERLRAAAVPTGAKLKGTSEVRVLFGNEAAGRVRRKALLC